eukprot:1425436-Alexandrium_andersonii.AAC.1
MFRHATPVNTHFATPVFEHVTKQFSTQAGDVVDRVGSNSSRHVNDHLATENARQELYDDTCESSM